MTATAAAWLVGMAFAASGIGGMLGMASGIFLVPMLTMVAHLPIRAAVGLSLISVICCSCASAPAYLDARLTNIRLAVVLEVATTTGALAGVICSGIMAPRALYLLFAAVLALSAWQMARPRHVALRPGVRRNGFVRQLDGRYPDRSSGHEIAYEVHRLPLGLAMMFGAGLLSALLGIGSGVLKIPAMDNALRLPMKVSSATSSFMIGVTAAVGAIAYGLSGAVDLSRAGPICLGSVAGSVAGAVALRAVDPKRLRLLFILVLLLLAAGMTYVAIGRAPPVPGG
jgi:uncharacterized membrane protein YfcA